VVLRLLEVPGVFWLLVLELSEATAAVAGAEWLLGEAAALPELPEATIAVAGAGRH